MKIYSLVFLFLFLFQNIDCQTTKISFESGKNIEQIFRSIGLQSQILGQKISHDKIIKIAIIDDGFRLSHNTIKKYIYTNEREVPGNYQDDDKNGYVDDIHGWDFADNDKDVSIAEGEENKTYHGTYIASIIVSLIENVFGEEASKHVKIIPIKTLSDNAKTSYLKDGYKGFKYADMIDADIVCAAWSGGVMTDDENSTLIRLIQKGTIVISSAGNFSNEKIMSPAKNDGVICVAAVDSLHHKLKSSNYGMRVDIVAPGLQIYGAHPNADNAFIYEKGTSPATAIITGSIAILKLLFPSATFPEINNAIQNTATTINHLDLKYSGKLGAGLPNMGKAIQFLKNINVEKYLYFDTTLTQGNIFIKKTNAIQKWKLRPEGDFKGVHLYSNDAQNDGLIKIFSKELIAFEGKLNELLGGIFLEGNAFDIEFKSKNKNKGRSEITYKMETIDSTILYCKGNTKYNISGEGVLSDNSKENNYANECSCQWQLIAPVGKRIKIEMIEIDTEPNVDYIWIFDGSSTVQEKLLAKLSGIKQPPIIQSLSNKMLIWFLTDKINTGNGWKLKYTVID